MQEQGEAEESQGNVSGVRLTHRVGGPWDKETDWLMPHQFGGRFQELVEVSEISGCGVACPD